jgi:hypothetical protein
MRSLLTVTVCLLMVGAPQAQGIVVEQLTEGLIPGVDWEYNSADGSTTVLRAHSDKTFVFWAHKDGDPDTLASIFRITHDPLLLTSGTVKIKISKTEQGLTPGATEIGAITIDEAGNDDITSYLEGINITGDFLAQEAMTVDHVTGDMEFGDPYDGTPAGLHHALTVNRALPIHPAG